MLFILVGEGANGKTTLVRTMQLLLGDYGDQTSMRTLITQQSGGIRNDIARLDGLRFVAASEAEGSNRLADATIKQLTGGDAVTARLLYREYQTYTPQIKLWLSTNHLPEILGHDEGIWRRLRVIRFDRLIPEEERDGDLLDKLAAERSGILNWALEGCRAYLEVGLQLPDCVRDATRRFRAAMDPIGRFADEHRVAGARTTSAALYAAYGAWCDASGEERKSQKAFFTRLQELGIERFRTNAARGWIGIGIGTEALAVA